MKKIVLALFLFIAVLPAKAQQDSLSSLTLTIGQDSYFGFYVSGMGSYAVTKKASLTFYANYWANPAFGNASTGTDFWTEVGLGVNFLALQGKLNLNPSVGFTYGKVLSGGDKGVLGDGIVPGLYASCASSKIDVNGGVYWFKALRKEGPVNTDYLWAWFSPGYKLNQRVTTGIHTELLSITRCSNTSPQALYQWLGPFVQYNFPKGSYLKAAAGYDAINKSFIKLNISIPLSN